MSEQHIHSDVVYKHDEYGEVLVSSIAELHETWDVANEDAPHPKEVVVYFHSDFDGYGGMPTHLHSEEVHTFAKRVTEERDFERAQVSELREE